MINAMVLHRDMLYVGGAFKTVGGVQATNVARWDGTNWSALGNFSGGVQTLAATAEGLFVGGQFTSISGVPATNVARWDGTNWHALGNGLNGAVWDLFAGPDGIYAGGPFTASGTLLTKGIARWDGQSWHDVGGGINHSAGSAFAHAFATDGSNVFVGGSFDSAGPIAALYVAKWDGTNWSSLGSGLGATVHSLAKSPLGIYAGGNFNRVGASPAGHVALWDGSVWKPLGAGIASDRSPSIVALAVNGSDLFVGGVEFSGAGEIVSSNIVRWDGEAWSTLEGGVTGRSGGSVHTLVAKGSELFVGGYFDYVGGKPSYHFARWHIPHALTSQKSGTNLTLSWPATGSNFVLEAKSNLTATNWSPVGTARQVVGDQLVVTKPPSGSNAFYRLRR